VAFDHGYRVSGFEGLTVYQSPEQWEPIAYSLARRAADEVAKYRELIPDLQAAAAVCAQDDLRYGGWHTWYAAVASGLVGKIAHSRDRFAAVINSSDDRDWWVRAQDRARVLRDLVENDHEEYLRQVRGVVEETRSLLKLPPREHGLPEHAG